MKTHVCPQCGIRKPYGEFNKTLRAGPAAPWNFRRCKACAHKEYEDRYATPKRRRSMNETSANWKKQNPEKHAEINKRYRQRNPEKITAQNRLNYAIRKGRIKRQPCEQCGATEKVHAHHTSYEPKDWYNVRWLCYVCHEIEHG